MVVLLVLRSLTYGCRVWWDFNGIIYWLFYLLHTSTLLLAMPPGPEPIPVSLATAPHEFLALPRAYIVVPHLLHGKARTLVFRLTTDGSPIYEETVDNKNINSNLTYAMRMDSVVSCIIVCNEWPWRLNIQTVTVKIHKMTLIILKRWHFIK
jgi:hypothetical protein